MKGEYTIVGDTEQFKDCLIYVCANKELAKLTLDRMLNNPTPDDKYAMRGHTNLRVCFTPQHQCWWNDPFLAN